MQKWHRLTLQLCLHSCSVLWFTTNQRPTVSVVQTTWGYRRAVYIMMLEKDGLIDGKRRKECSLEDSWKVRHQSWPVMFLFLVDEDDFSKTYVQSVYCQLRSHDDCYIVCYGNLKEYELDWCQVKNRYNLLWIRNFISRKKLNKKGLNILTGW